MMHPMGQDGVDIDAIVGQQPVNLFDSVFGDQATREGQPLTDCMNRQRCGPDDAERGIGQRQNAFSVHVSTQQISKEPVNAVEAKGLVRFHRLPRVSGYLRVESERNGFRQPAQDKRKIRNRERALLIPFGILKPTSWLFYYVANSNANEGMHKAPEWYRGHLPICSNAK